MNLCTVCGTLTYTPISTNRGNGKDLTNFTITVSCQAVVVLLCELGVDQLRNLDCEGGRVVVELNDACGAVARPAVEHKAKQEVEEGVSKRKVRRLSYIAGDCRELGSTTKPPSPADRIKQLYVGAGSSIPQDLR